MGLRVVLLIAASALAWLVHAAVLSQPAAAATSYLHPYVTYPVGSRPEAVAIGDLNHDGLPDVALTTAFWFDSERDFSVFVFLQDGAGGFRTPARYATGGDFGLATGTIDVGDVTGDGRDDVVVGNNTDIVVLPQNAVGTLDPAVKYPTTSSYKIRIGDFNADGRLDVIGIDWGSQSSRIDIYAQRTDGTLEFAGSTTGQHPGFDDLEVGDLNNDGREDFVLRSAVNFRPAISVFLQRPQGLFDSAMHYELGIMEGIDSVGVGDLNGDGRADVAVANYGNRPQSVVGIWPQTSMGTLDSASRFPSHDSPEAVEVADADSDGRLDLLVAHGGFSTMGVYRQQSDGTLAAEELFPLPFASFYNTQGLVVGDITGDFINDVVIADYNGIMVVLAGKGSPLRATAVSQTRVQVTWNAAPGAISYEVYRRPPEGPFTLLGTSTAPTFDDVTAGTGSVYLYRVRAFYPGGRGVTSAYDLATTMGFTDDPIVAGTTVVKAAHLAELRAAVGGVRALAGLSPATFTDLATGTPVRAVHVTELRTALDAARVALSLPAGSYTGSITAGSVIRAVHVQEIRDLVK